MDDAVQIQPRPKGKGGRPRKRLRAELVRALANAQLTNLEIASRMGCDDQTITRRFGSEQLQKWRDEGVGNARRELYLTAMRSGPGKIAALIFFLKNYGKMSDFVETRSPLNFGTLPGFDKYVSDQSGPQPGTADKPN